MPGLTNRPSQGPTKTEERFSGTFYVLCVSGEDPDGGPLERTLYSLSSSFVRTPWIPDDAPSAASRSEDSVSGSGRYVPLGRSPRPQVLPHPAPSSLGHPHKHTHVYECTHTHVRVHTRTYTRVCTSPVTLLVGPVEVRDVGVVRGDKECREVDRVSGCVYDPTLYRRTYEVEMGTLCSTFVRGSRLSSGKVP